MQTVVTVLAHKPDLSVEHNEEAGAKFRIRAGDNMQSSTLVSLALDRPAMEHLRDLIIAELAAEEADRTGLCQVAFVSPDKATRCLQPIVPGSYACKEHGGALSSEPVMHFDTAEELDAALDPAPIPFDRAKMPTIVQEAANGFRRDPAPYGRCAALLDNGEACSEPLDGRGIVFCEYHRKRAEREAKAVPDAL